MFTGGSKSALGLDSGIGNDSSYTNNTNCSANETDINKTSNNFLTATTNKELFEEL